MRRTGGHNHVYMLYAFVALLMLSGCHMRELTYDYHPFCEVTLNVDWSRHSETPDGMTAIFYPVDGGKAITHTTHEVQSTRVSLREGVYNVILFSNSPIEYSTSFGFRGMDRYETAEIYLLESSSKGWYTKTEGEKVAVVPDPIAVATIEGFEVTGDMIDIQRAEAKAAAEAKAKGIEAKADTKVDTKAYISLSPKNIIAGGKIKIHIDGINNLRSVRGSISGMTEGFVPSTFTTTSSPVTHVLDQDEWSDAVYDEGSDRNGYITTNYLTFGLPSMQVSKAEAKSNCVRGGISLSRAGRAAGADWSGVRLDLQILLVDNKPENIVKVSYMVGDHIRIIEETHEVILDLEIEEARPLDPDNGANILIPVRPDDPDSPGSPDDGGDTLVLPDVDPEGSTGGFGVTVEGWGEIVDVEVELK